MLSTPVISLFHEGRSWHVIQYSTSINYTSTPGIHGDEGMGIPCTNIKLKAPFENVFKNSIALLQEFWASTCLDNTSECDLIWLQAFLLNSPKQLYHADAGHIQKSLQSMEQHCIWAFHLVLDMHLLDSHTLKMY